MATARAHNKIQLIFRGRIEEAYSGETNLLPGMLAYIESNGTVKSHDRAGTGGECMIVDMDLKGGKTVDDAYDATAGDDLVQLLLPLPGDVLAVLIANGTTTVAYDGLTSNGDGTFKNATDGDQQMFIAMEAVTGDGVTLCKARCIPTCTKTEEST